MALGPPVSDICTGDLITQGEGCTSSTLEWWRHDCEGGHFHAGVDIGWSDGGAQHLGAPIRATRAGVVVAIGPLDAAGGLDLGPWAPVIRTDAEGAFVQYGHASACLVHLGDHVDVGQVIAQVGSRGSTAGGAPTSTAPHLHLEVRRDGPVQGPPWVVGGMEAVLDPTPWLRNAARRNQMDNRYGWVHDDSGTIVIIDFLAGTYRELASEFAVHQVMAAQAGEAPWAEMSTAQLTAALSRLTRVGVPPQVPQG